MLERVIVPAAQLYVPFAASTLDRVTSVSDADALFVSSAQRYPLIVHSGTFGEAGARLDCWW